MEKFFVTLTVLIKSKIHQDLEFFYWGLYRIYKFKKNDNLKVNRDHIDEILYSL